MVRSSWLTAARLGRLPDALEALPSRAPGVDAAEAHRRVWRQCGGPVDDVGRLIEVLVATALAERLNDRLRRSAVGERLLRQRAQQGLRPLGLALLRAGYFHDQVRLLIEVGSIDEEGRLVCRPRWARKAAPQLVGVLEWWADVSVAPMLVVPTHLLNEVGAVWALLPPVLDTVGTDAIRKTIGNRAELYSYQLERLRSTASGSIIWVARDDDTLGYDIEDRSSAGTRQIEVKGSGGRPVRFFLSENEMRKSHELPGYEIHFWGGIDLSQSVAEEFERLRGEGYPLIYTDIPGRLTSGELMAAPIKWRVHADAG